MLNSREHGPPVEHSKLKQRIAGHSRLGQFLVAGMLYLSVGCAPPSEMVPFSPRFSRLDLPRVPVILVAQALEDCRPAGPLQSSEWDGRPVQLYRVRVKVELIIQGDVDSKTSDIFYFVDQGTSSGAFSHLTNIRSGSSEVFLLQKDGNRLRTICEGWRSCVLWVRTGSHYKSTIDPNVSMYDSLMKVLLGRGDGTSGGQMIDAINHPEAVWGWKPVIKRLREISRADSSPIVRSVASEKLRQLQEHFGEGTEFIPNQDGGGSFQ